MQDQAVLLAITSLMSILGTVVTFWLRGKSSDTRAITAKDLAQARKIDIESQAIVNSELRCLVTEMRTQLDVMEKRFDEMCKENESLKNEVKRLNEQLDILNRWLQTLPQSILDTLPAGAR
jgi:TolA-binding protein